MPILALCSNAEICRRLAISWGVQSALVEPISGTAHLVKLSADAAVRILGATMSDVMAIVAGTPFNVPGKTNLIKVQEIADALKSEQAGAGE
jgi:pyruvate kinase